MLVAPLGSKAIMNLSFTLALLLASFMWIRRPDETRDWQGRWAKLPLRRFWLLYFVGVLLSWVGTYVLLSRSGQALSFRPMLAIKGMFCYFLFYLAFEDSPRTLRRLLTAALILSALICTALLLQHGLTTERLSPTLSVFGKTLQLGGINKVSALYTTVVLMTLSAVLFAPMGGTSRGAAIALCLPIVLVILGMQSRTSQLALLVGVAMLFARRYGKLLALGCVIFMAVAFALENPRINMRMVTVDSKTDFRFHFVRRALKGIARRPLLGHGLRVENEVTNRSPEDDCYDGHNTLLTIWLRQGLLAALAAAGLLFGHLGFLIRLLKAPSEEGHSDPWLWGLTMSTVVAILVSLAFGAWNTPSYRFLFFFTLAMVARLHGRRFHGQDRNPSEEKPENGRA